MSMKGDVRRIKNLKILEDVVRQIFKLTKKTFVTLRGKYTRPFKLLIPKCELHFVEQLN